MTKFRARVLSRPILLLALVLAAVLGASSGVGYAAMRNPAPEPAVSSARLAISSSQSSPTTSLVWHQLKLLNGWVSAASWGTGPPSYAVSAQGVVYFAGSLRNGNTNLAAFVMPVGTRPGYYDCFAIYSNTANDQEVGALHIYATGKAYVQGPSAQFFSSLAGATYVVGH
jgi:hypothetical protein